MTEDLLGCHSRPRLSRRLTFTTHCCLSNVSDGKLQNVQKYMKIYIPLCHDRFGCHRTSQWVFSKSHYIT